MPFWPLSATMLSEHQRLKFAVGEFRAVERLPTAGLLPERRERARCTKFVPVLRQERRAIRSWNKNETLEARVMLSGP